MNESINPNNVNQVSFSHPRVKEAMKAFPGIPNVVMSGDGESVNIDESGDDLGLYIQIFGNLVVVSIPGDLDRFGATMSGEGPVEPMIDAAFEKFSAPKNLR